MNVIIDTNVLYIWSGLVRDDRLSSNDLDSFLQEHSVAISSTAVLEIVDAFSRPEVSPFNVVKWSERKYLLYKIIKFIKKKEIFQIPTAEVSERVMRGLSVCRPKSCRVISTMRKRAEVSLLHPIYLALLQLNLSVLTTAYAKDQSDPLTKQLWTLAAMNCKLWNDEIQRTLETGVERGWNEGRPEKFVKQAMTNKFKDWLFETAVNANIIIEGAVGNPSALESAAKSIVNDPIWIKLSKEAVNPFSILGSLEYRPLIESQLNGLSNYLADTNGLPPAFLQYFSDYLAHSTEVGRSPQKNDTLDWLPLIVLNGSSRVYLTLDDNVRKLLLISHPDSAAFADTLLTFKI
jgi:hypothetical protein